MLRLEVELAERPDEALPTLDSDARREDGPEATILVGDSARELTPPGELARAPRCRSGISTPHRSVRSVTTSVRNKTTQRIKRRTTLDFVRLGIVSDVRRLGFGDFHETIFLYLRQRNVCLVPL